MRSLQNLGRRFWRETANFKSPLKLWGLLCISLKLNQPPLSLSIMQLYAIELEDAAGSIVDGTVSVRSIHPVPSSSRLEHIASTISFRSSIFIARHVCVAIIIFNARVLSFHRNESQACSCNSKHSKLPTLARMALTNIQLYKEITCKEFRMQPFVNESAT